MNNMNDMNEKQLQAQIDKVEEEYMTVKKQSSKRKSIINYIAEKICDFNYAKNQLGGPNQIFSMSDVELRDFIVENFYSQKKQMAEIVRGLQELYQKEKKEKEEFAKQVVELRNKVAELEEEKANRPTGNPLSALVTPQGSKSSIVAEAPQVEEVDSLDESDVLMVGNKVYDVAQEMRKIDLYQEELVRVIGEFGFSETKDIYAKTIERTGTSETNLKNKLPELEKFGIVEKEDVSTSVRRKLALYALSPLGQSIYKRLTGKNPVVAEKDVLKRQHSTLKHAYCIKDTASILESLGYTNVSIDSSANQIQVAGGHRYVPDIIAHFSKDEVTYWEIELAHHKDNDFFDKLSKAAKVTNTLYIIANEKEGFDKLKTQIGHYQRYLITNDININFTIFLGTINQLKQRNIFTNPDCKIKIG